MSLPDRLTESECEALPLTEKGKAPYYFLGFSLLLLPAGICAHIKPAA